MQFPLYRSIRLRIAKFFNKSLSFLGFYLVIDDFYTPIPSVREISSLRFSNPPLPYNHDSLALDFHAQSSFLSSILCTSNFNLWDNPGLSSLDSVVLHSIVSSLRFNNIIEIGAGYSSQIIENAIVSSQLTSSHLIIDPFLPNRVLNMRRDELSFSPCRIQDCSLEDFANCDFLFIDSSHVIKTDSDCMFEFFEILPILPKGCIVHFHDIMIPFSYWLDWHQSGHQYWNESYFLHAFLSSNSVWKTLYSARAFHTLMPDLFENQFGHIPHIGRHTSYYIVKN